MLVLLEVLQPHICKMTLLMLMMFHGEVKMLATLIKVSLIFFCFFHVVIFCMYLFT